MGKVLSEQNTEFKEIELMLPAFPEMVKVARLTVSGIASGIGFGIDEIEDIKVAVAEICNIIIKKSSSQFDRYRLKFVTGDKSLQIKFVFENFKPSGFKLFDDSEAFGEAIINALVDEVRINKLDFENEIISIALFLKESRT